MKWTYQCTPDDGRVMAETYVGWIKQKYENRKVHSLVQKLKINVKMHGEHKVKLNNLRYQVAHDYTITRTSSDNIIEVDQTLKESQD